MLRWIGEAAALTASAPVHLILHGAAGAGKSAVAVHVAAGLEFAGGRLFASLRDRAPGAVLADLLRSLGCPEGAVPAGLAERVRLYRSMTAGRRVLVVLDDAADEQQVRPLLPTGPGSLTLVTSRSPLSGLEAARAVELGVLDPAEAVAMLAGVADEHRVRAEPQAAHRIAALCGGLPLALRIAGSRLARRPDWTLGHLAGRLGDERGRLDELSAGDLAVRGSLSLGYLGLCADERLLLRRLGALPAPGFAPWAAAAVLLAPAERLLEALVEAGLVQSRGLDDAGQERYGLHDLTRLYCAERLAQEEGPPARVLAAAAREILDRTRRARAMLLPAEPGSGHTQARTAEQLQALETTHLRRSASWLAAERGFLVATVADLHRCGLDEEAWRLAFYLTPFFELGAHHDGWRASAGTGLAAARRAGHRQGEALLLRSLADLHRVEGRLDDAAEALRAALRLADCWEEARTMHRLGLVHLDQERPAEADRCFTARLATFEATGDVRGRADALRALGGLRGDAELLGHALGLFRELGDPRGEAAALLDLARTYLAGRALARARDCAAGAVRLSRRLGDRLPEAAGLLVVARIAGAEGFPDAARSAGGEALEICESRGDRRGAAHARLILARTFLEMDEVNEAVDTVTRAMAEFAALGDGRCPAEAEQLAQEARRRRGLRI